MKKTSLRHVLHVFCVSLAYILSTASACDGDSSGSGGGSDEIRNDATYEFEKVNLVYEIPEESGTLTSIYVDFRRIIHGPLDRWDKAQWDNYRFEQHFIF